MNSSTLPRVRAAAVLTVGASLMTFGAAAASAHVSVTPDSTSADGFSQLTFKVPNESQTAKTSKLAVTLPVDTPFTSVSVQPMEGWTAEVLDAALAVPITVKGAMIIKAPASVVWTADEAHQVFPRQYQAFYISVGRLPREGTILRLPAAQTYSDGTVVNWSEAAVAGQDKPAHPAPSFTTPPAGDQDAHGPADLDANSSVVQDGGGAVAGWTGLAAGLKGLAARATAPARTRRADAKG